MSNPAEPLREVGAATLPRVRLETPNETVRHAWDQAIADLEALRLEDPTFDRSVVIPAAGASRSRRSTAGGSVVPGKASISRPRTSGTAPRSITA